MRFEWDENKRLINLKKHGFDFADAKIVFDNETATIADNRFDYGEIRYVTFGVLHGRFVSITHTESDQALRIISIRKSTKDEENYYLKEIRN